jgi:hypothetical protein
VNPIFERVRDGARFIGITVVLTVTYLLLMQANQRIFDTLEGTGVFDAERWAEEARTVAAESAEAERRLPSAHRLAAWRLGFDLGYASEWLGSVVALGPDAQARTRSSVADRLRQAETIAEALGIGSVQPLPMRTLEDFNRLPERIEADETGLAAALEKRLSPRHKHLFLFGMHVGSELFSALATAGEAIGPYRAKIGRHATLAGIPAELWQPVAEEPIGLEPAQASQRYRTAVEAVDAYLARAANVMGRAS